MIFSQTLLSSLLGFNALSMFALVQPARAAKDLACTTLKLVTSPDASRKAVDKTRKALVTILERAASFLPFWCLILDHLECPAKVRMRCVRFVGYVGRR